jgi:hypothetical protein
MGPMPGRPVAQLPRSSPTLGCPPFRGWQGWALAFRCGPHRVGSILTKPCSPSGVKPEADAGPILRMVKQAAFQGIPRHVSPDWDALKRAPTTARVRQAAGKSQKAILQGLKPMEG